MRKSNKEAMKVIRKFCPNLSIDHDYIVIDIAIDNTMLQKFAVFLEENEKAMVEK